MAFGLCSYPHGWFATTGLIVLCMGAVAMTAYAVASCHFVVVEFTSVRGTFEEYFDGVRTAGDVEQHKVGAGLFTWLKPKENQNEWSNGECIGYSERMRDSSLSDGYFEASRFFGIVVVLFGVVVLVWSFVLACLPMRKWQLYLYRGLLLLLVILTCLEFLIKKSALCTEFQQDTSCSLANGGLVNVAGAVLWFATFLLATFCINVEEQKKMKLKKEMDEARRRRRRRRERRQEREEQDRSVPANDVEVAMVSSSKQRPSTPETTKNDDDDDEIADEQAIEVNIGSFLDRVESIVEEE